MIQPSALGRQAAPTLRLLGSVKTAGITAALGVSAYKNLAFTGAPDSITSVAIIDISDPAAPVFVGQTPVDPSDMYGFEEHRALRIGLRDILAVYVNSSYDGSYHTVLKLFDIGDPAHPVLIGAFQTIRGGYHFEVVQQGRRSLALLSGFQAEALSSTSAIPRTRSWWVSGE
jgi:hypothetical protein